MTFLALPIHPHPVFYPPPGKKKTLGKKNLYKFTFFYNTKKTNSSLHINITFGLPFSSGIKNPWSVYNFKGTWDTGCKGMNFRNQPLKSRQKKKQNRISLNHVHLLLFFFRGRIWGIGKNISLSQEHNIHAGDPSNGTIFHTTQKSTAENRYF